MMKILILQITLLQIIIAANIEYGDKEIIKMMSEYFRVESKAPELINHSFYVQATQTIFQIEIRTNPKFVNDALLFSFKAINQLANIAKTKFTHSVVLIHFFTNALPVMAESKLDCSKKFFIDGKNTEKEWLNNCLIINNY